MDKNIIINWLEKINKFEEDKRNIEVFIKKQFYDKFIFKVIKKIGELDVLIPIDIEERQYAVEPIKASILIRSDDKNKYFQYLLNKRFTFFTFGYPDNYCRSVVFYKNYTRQYKDIELIFNALDNYLDKRIIPEWNTVDAIDEAIEFVERHVGVKKSNDDFLYVDADLINTCEKSLKSLYYSDFIEYANIYKTILSSHKNIDLQEISLFDLNDTLKFIKNFEVNKYLFTEINSDNFILKINDLPYKVVDGRIIKKTPEQVNKEINELIKDIFKRVNTHLYEEVCRKKNKKEKNTSVLVDYNDWDYELSNLFYNPMFFKFLLPKDFNINGSRILVQVSFDLNVQDIKIMFSFLNNGKEESCEVVLYDFVNNTDKLLNNIDGIYDDNRKEHFIKLVNLIKTNKFFILEHILSEIEKRFGGKQTNNLSLYEVYLTNYMDQYLSNLK